MRCQINRPVLHHRARRIFPKKVVAPPVRGGPDRSREESATAVGTDIAENPFDARFTERALIRTNPRLKRIRRQRLVAMFARWSEFKHADLNVRLSIGQPIAPGTYFPPDTKTPNLFVPTPVWLDELPAAE